MPARTKKAVHEAAAASSSSESEGDAKARISDDNSSEDEDQDEDQSGTNSDSEDHEDGSDSDSLDSSAPRKRRKISPIAPSEDEDEEDDEIPKAPAAFISAPSRIRKRAGDDLKQPSEESSSKVAAPPAAVFGGATTAPTDPNTNFEALGVHPWLVRSLTNMAIRRPTGIQKGCIPEILKGRDCIGGSRTGSGKTVAFAVPILQKWAEDPSAIFAVVLTPTRYV